MMQGLWRCYFHYKFVLISSYLPYTCTRHCCIGCIRRYYQFLTFTLSIEYHDLCYKILRPNIFMYQRHFLLIENMYTSLRGCNESSFIQVNNAWRITQWQFEVRLKTICLRSHRINIKLAWTVSNEWKRGRSVRITLG